MTDESLTSMIVLAGLVFVFSFRWGMGRLAESIDDFHESWKKVQDRRDGCAADDNEEESS